MSATPSTPRNASASASMSAPSGLPSIRMRITPPISAKRVPKDVARDQNVAIGSMSRQS
jgi:hypothetical protein